MLKSSRLFRGEGPKNPIPSSVAFGVVGGKQEIPGKVFYNFMGIIINFGKKSFSF